MTEYDAVTHDQHDLLYGPTRQRVHPSPQDDVAVPEPEPQVSNGPPPRTGAGSSREEWAAYAASLGLTVPDDLGRDEIIALVDQASTEE